MPRYTPGIRVGAIRNTQDKKVFLFGYGTYVGDEEVEITLEGEGSGVVMKNPKIQLDNGDVVWGYQCWWGPEDQIKKTYEGWATETVPVPSKEVATHE